MISQGMKKKLIAEYDYVNEKGNLLYQNCRYDPKNFVQRKPNGRDWCYNLNGVRRVPYHLPEIISATQQDWIFFVEGEADVEALRKLGLTATTTGSVTSWQDAFKKYFKNKLICIIPDNDEKGRDFARKVAKSLYSVATEIRILNLPGLQEKEDVSDWLRNGGNKHQFIELIDNVPKYEPPKKRIQTIPLSEVEEKNIGWLWDNRIPKNMFSLLVGNVGATKSFLSIYLAAQISTGRPLAGAKIPTEKGSTIIFSNEDPLDVALKPRLNAHEADCSKIFAYSFVNLKDSKTDEFSLLEHLDLLGELIDEIGDVKLIIFDPITAYLRGVDANSNSEVRTALIGLQNLCQTKETTALGISHFSKKAQLDVIYRTLGSTAFNAAARSVWAIIEENVGRNSKKKPRKLFMPVKANYSVRPQGLAYTIKDGAVCFSEEPVEGTINQAMKGGFQKGEKVQSAKTWLENILRSGPVPSKELWSKAQNAGHSTYSIDTASKELGIRKFREGYGDKGHHFWSLPTDLNKENENSQPS